ncbi:MAG: hypothetical protein ACYC0V_12490 [Armatimonadota bacterium]
MVPFTQTDNAVDLYRREALEFYDPVDPEGDLLAYELENPSEDSLSGDNTVRVDGRILNEFHGPNRNIFLRHLASSCKWFLTDHNGKLYAERRFIINSCWNKFWHGYYSNQINYREGVSQNYYRIRIILAPDGSVLDIPYLPETTYANAGAGKIKLKSAPTGVYDRDKKGSYLVVKSRAGALEILEESKIPTRPFTNLAIKQIERELRAVLKSRKARSGIGYDPHLMPNESIRKGNAELTIGTDGNDGCYQVYAYANPGEFGKTYLKIINMADNSPLADFDTSLECKEYIGWSKDPAIKFLYNTKAFIAVDTYDQQFNARFELWFHPLDGKRPDRKLLERTFLIMAGWLSHDSPS